MPEVTSGSSGRRKRRRGKHRRKNRKLEKLFFDLSWLLGGLALGLPLLGIILYLLSR